jgi:hypothetical protein
MMPRGVHMARSLQAGTALLGLLAALSLALWAGTLWWRLGDISFAVPIAPAQELRINVWKPVADDKSWGYDGMIAHEIDRPLTAMLWYQHTGIVSATRLATVELPSWPLLAIAAGSALLVVVALRLARGQRHRRE